MIGFAYLVERARALAAGPGRTVLGITGSPGAGKSTLAAALLAELVRGTPLAGVVIALCGVVLISAGT